MKEFNTTGLCNPRHHYMVDITDRLKIIATMIDDGEYFTINRARQYGKTTTLSALSSFLEQKYLILSLDFQDLEDGSFADGGVFSQTISRIIIDAFEFEGLAIPPDIRTRFKEIIDRPSTEVKMDDLFRVFKFWFDEEDKGIVLIIDEVDSATNNQVFLDFLAQLRSLYLKHARNPEVRTFKSVILAGVTDVKHVKSKMRDQDQHKVNSPWNIAVDFKIDMSLSADGIRGMLKDYEADHNTGMDVTNIATAIYDYTEGYPFLVSKICSIMDKSSEILTRIPDRNKVWTTYGVDEAVKLLLREENVTLFDSLIGKLINYPELNEKVYRILMRGEVLESLPYDEAQKQLRMYGFIKEDNGIVRIANRIFETLLYNHFLGQMRDGAGNEIKQTASFEKNLFVKDGELDIPLIFDHFIKAYKQIFGELQDRFKEKDGREIFLLYLRPIINGTGNYYIEAQTRDQRRTDIIIDYLGKQYIIELKIWHGERYNAEGEKQISGYLDYFGLDTGYMLSFNFNKTKDTGVKKVEIDGKVLYEGML